MILLSECIIYRMQVKPRFGPQNILQLDFSEFDKMLTAYRQPLQNLIPENERSFEIAIGYIDVILFIYIVFYKQNI